MMLRVACVWSPCNSYQVALVRTIQTVRPARVSPWTLRSILSRNPARHLSWSAQFNNEDRSHDEASNPLFNDGQLDEIEKLPTQKDVVDLLETQLGISLEEAIRQDKTAVQALVEKLSSIDGSGLFVEAASDPLQDMRRAGATQSDIAREARNVFGDSLPEKVLNEEEFVLYRRLYGEPTSDIAKDSVLPEDDSEVDLSSVPQNALYTADGVEVNFEKNGQAEGSKHEDVQEWQSFSRPSVETADASNFLSRSPSDQGNMIVAEDDFDEDFDDLDTNDQRQHPFTTLGKFTTSPKTIFLPPNEFVRPVEKLMSNFSNKHLKEMCERTFGGPGLPDSPLTPRSGKFKQQVPIPLEANQSAMGEMEANAFMASVMPPTYASIMSVLVETRKRLGTSWLTKLLARDGGPRVLDASSGGVGIIAWREMVKAHWDAIHTSDRHPPPVPASKTVVLTGSDTLRHRAASMLENTTFVPRLPDYSHTRDVPTLEDERPAQQRKQFDVIIAPHSLFPLKEDWMRKQYVQNLWSQLSPESGILILIEKGIPRGFEAIAGAREMLLERYIAIPPGRTTHYSGIVDDSIHSKETAMIVAPCTNHEKCPMYTVPGLSRGRRDICSFQQRYIRPPFLQRILGASDRNHDDVEFSYLSVVKGDDIRTREFVDWSHVENPSSAPIQHSLTKPDSVSIEIIKKGFEGVLPHETNQSPLPGTHQLPRAILPPIKRKGHVSLDLCTPTGKIERWTVPKSFSKQAHRDARKARWGDLWALGAKTRVPRNLSVGISEKDMASKKKTVEVKGRSRNERLKMQAQKLLEAREEERMVEIDEQDKLMKDLDEEFNVTTEQRQSRSAPTKPQSSPEHAESVLSDDDISASLAEWQDEFDQRQLQSGKQVRRLNKLDKRKLKQEAKMQQKIIAANRARR